MIIYEDLNIASVHINDCKVSINHEVERKSQINEVEGSGRINTLKMSLEINIPFNLIIQILWSLTWFRMLKIF
jgi:hypothetical protein